MLTKKTYLTPSIRELLLTYDAILASSLQNISEGHDAEWDSNWGNSKA